MTKKILKGLMVVLLVSSLILVSSLFVSPAKAYIGSTIPSDAVQVWGTQWDDMHLWLHGGTPLNETQIDGIFTVHGDFPALVMNSTMFTEASDYSIYTFHSSGSAQNMWFTTRYAFDGLDADNFFSMFLLSGHQGDPALYSIDTLGGNWRIQAGLASNMTTIAPDPSGIIDVFLHFTNETGYALTYIDGVLIDNATAIDLGYGISGAGFQLDSNSWADNMTVVLSGMGAYLPLADVPPTPTPTPTPHPAGPGPMWSGSHSSSSNTSPAPVQQVSISIKGLADYQLILVIATVVIIVLALLYYYRKKK